MQNVINFDPLLDISIGKMQELKCIATFNSKYSKNVFLKNESEVEFA